MIDIQFDERATLQAVDRSERQVLFATSRAINATVKDVQTEIRAHVDREFTIRSAQSRTFLHRSVFIPKFSRKDDNPIMAEIDVAGSRGFQRSRWGLLAKFEKGGRRTAGASIGVIGQQPFFIPTEAIRPSFGAAVPRALYPKNLRLLARMGGGANRTDYLAAQRGTRKKVLGEKRSFFVLGQPGEKRWGIYERTGEGRGDFRMVWAFRQSIDIPPVLQFSEIARRVSSVRLPDHFNREFALAMATARPS